MYKNGDIIGGMYTILRKVGNGAMSDVYLASNEKANQQWAVKVVRKDGPVDSEIKKQRLAVEIEIMKGLRHKHLPRIIDVQEAADSYIIIMDFVEGISLDKAMEAAGGALPQEDVIQWAIQLCDTLHYLHTKEPPIIYRDMKPHNIMRRPDNTIALIDFGTAREYKDGNAADTIALGTKGYAAPEQFMDPNGKVQQTDARTDIYALGVTLHQLLTGKNPTLPPYEFRPIREYDPTLHEGLESIIQKCIQPDPAKRYQSAAELQFALMNMDKITRPYWIKQRNHMIAFLVPLTLSVVLGITSMMSLGMSNKKLSENYEHQLARAQSIEEIYDAIMTAPTRLEAYATLNEFVISDDVVTTQEADVLNQLLVGLNGEDGKGYNQSVYVLDELREVDPEGYRQVCFDFGWSLISRYEGDDESRYKNAAKWLEPVRTEDSENGRNAEMFCQIAEITTKIKRLGNSKVTETGSLAQERNALWELVQTLKEASANYQEARRLECSVEIAKLIERSTVDFLNVVPAETLIGLLEQMQTEAEPSRSNPDYTNLVARLDAAASAAIQKLMSLQG